MVALLPAFLELIQADVENIENKKIARTNVKRQPYWWDFDCMRAKQDKFVFCCCCCCFMLLFFLRNFRQSIEYTNFVTSISK